MHVPVPQVAIQELAKRSSSICSSTRTPKWIVCDTSQCSASVLDPSGSQEPVWWWADEQDFGLSFFCGRSFLPLWFILLCFQALGCIFCVFFQSLPGRALRSIQASSRNTWVKLATLSVLTERTSWSRVQVIDVTEDTGLLHATSCLAAMNTFASLQFLTAGGIIASLFIRAPEWDVRSTPQLRLGSNDLEPEGALDIPEALQQNSTLVTDM